MTDTYHRWWRYPGEDRRRLDGYGRPAPLAGTGPSQPAPGRTHASAL